MKSYICYPQGKAKALTMSYDDGQQFDRRLVDLFNKYGIKGTFNLNSVMMHPGMDDRRIDSDEVASLYMGHEVATHTSHHPTLERCPLVQVANEILEDRVELESLVGYPVRGHAYPNGSYTQEIKDLFHQLGIAYGRVVPSSYSFEIPTDPMEWYPTCHHADPRLMELAQTFAEDKKKQYMRLMYVWGHSYEFDRDDNWHIIEEFCEYISGRTDIWYATNIEIIDYISAARQLIYFADSSKVYNPTATTVWLEVNDSKYVSVEPGKMIELT